MKLIKLTPRLLAVANMVNEGVRIADVGTDHAFLPLYLLQNGKIEFAFASDINTGPLENANGNIKLCGFEDRVKTVLAHGLDGIEESCVDDVVIAGMGGELISQIINNAPWLRKSSKHLVLQPMTRANELRRYLCENGFEILKEKAVSEDEHIYTVISASYCGKALCYDDAFLYVGRLADNIDTDAEKYINNQINIIKKAADGMKKSSRDLDKADYFYNLAEKISALIKFGEN